jgi:N-acetylneuraminic acid mutarotase
VSNSTGPSPRLGHSLTLFKDDIYIFGGLSQETTFNELWVFNISTSTWTLLETKGEIPLERAAHSLTLFNDSQMILFGGLSRAPKLVAFDDVHVLDPTLLTWSKLDIPAMPPGPPQGRLDHSTVLVPFEQRDKEGVSTVNDTNQKSLFLFGGMSPQALYNDLFELSFM